MSTIVGLGEVLWDIYPDDRFIGGATANVALHAIQLGAAGVIVSAVGYDKAGEALIQQVEERGGDVRYIQKSIMYETGQVIVQLDEEGKPHFECSEDVAFDHLIWRVPFQALATTCDAVIVGTLAQREQDSRITIQKFLDAATAALVVYDVNFRGWREDIKEIIRETLKKADIVKMNGEELNMMRQAFGETSLSDEAFLNKLFKNYNIQMAAVTRGAEGCVMADSNGTVHHVPGHSVQVVDTTGCGDAFVAGLTLKYLEGASLEESGQFANRLGAFVSTKKGAVPLYSCQDIVKFFEHTEGKNGHS